MSSTTTVLPDYQNPNLYNKLSAEEEKLWKESDALLRKINFLNDHITGYVGLNTQILYAKLRTLEQLQNEDIEVRDLTPSRVARLFLAETSKTAELYLDQFRTTTKNDYISTTEELNDKIIEETLRIAEQIGKESGKWIVTPLTNLDAEKEKIRKGIDQLQQNLESSKTTQTQLFQEDQQIKDHIKQVETDKKTLRKPIKTTSIFEAAQKGDTSFIQAEIGKLGPLSSSKRFLDKVDPATEVAPLHLAAAHGQKDVVKLILNNNGSVDVRDGENYTPLHWASKVGEEDIAKELIQAKANLNAQSYRGRTPLHMAAYNGKLAIVKVLIAAGAKFNLQTNGPETPAKNRRTEVEQRRDPSDRKLTPLHEAVGLNRLDVVDELCKLDQLDIKLRDSDNKTALRLAVEMGSYDMVTHITNHAIRCHSWVLPTDPTDPNHLNNLLAITPYNKEYITQIRASLTANLR